MSEIVYFRDRAKELGREDVYELIDPSKSPGVPLDPSKPQGKKNLYIVNDLTVWQHIIGNQ